MALFSKHSAESRYSIDTHSDRPFENSFCIIPIFSQKTLHVFAFFQLGRKCKQFSKSAALKSSGQLTRYDINDIKNKKGPQKSRRLRSYCSAYDGL